MTKRPAAARPTRPDRSDRGVTGKDILLPLATSLLLTLSFPGFGFHALAWIALIPLLLQVEKGRIRKASLLAYLAGFFFLLFSLHWLRHVTLFGLLFVATYQALYFAAFGFLTYAFLRWRRGGSHPFARSVAALAGIPSLWTVLEWVRSEIPVFGFGWNLLGYSQSGNLRVAQLASLVGAYGVSFLVIMVNTTVFLMLRQKGVLKNVLLALLPAGILLATYGYGYGQMGRRIEGPVHRIGVIQGNIAQEEKWLMPAKLLIIEKYLKLTELAAAEQPDLLAWPEASYPGLFSEEYETSGVAALAKKIGSPLVVGSPHQGKDGSYYNSAFLLTSDGELAERYDKIFLVPFGEYVPFKPILFFLEPLAYALGVSNFRAGREFTVFELPAPRVAGGATRRVAPTFSTLICFEDIFPLLARRFVEQGARLLFVITNDAWFGKTAAPEQHLQTSIFRAIENRVFVIRAGNIGVSAFVSPFGEVLDRVRDEAGRDTYVTGFLNRAVPVFHEKTFYQSGGWLFPYACLLLVLIKISFSWSFLRDEKLN